MKIKPKIIDELLEINKAKDKDTHSHKCNINPVQEQDIISETDDDIWKCFDNIVNNSTSDNSNNSSFDFEDSSNTAFKRQTNQVTEVKINCNL